VTNVDKLHKDRMLHKSEIGRLQGELIKSQAEVQKLRKQIESAQHLFGMEKEKRIMAEKQVRGN